MTLENCKEYGVHRKYLKKYEKQTQRLFTALKQAEGDEDITTICKINDLMEEIKYQVPDKAYDVYRSICCHHIRNHYTGKLYEELHPEIFKNE